MSKIYAVRSYYDADLGALVELSDDVLGIVSQVRELYDDKVSIQLDPLTGWFHFVEHSQDGTDRLIFSVEELDGRALRRLQEADSHMRGHVDPYDALEREQDEDQARLDAAYRDQIREAGERLAHELKRSGMDDRLPLSAPVRRKRAKS